jgi:predicted acyltransferase
MQRYNVGPLNTECQLFSDVPLFSLVRCWFLFCVICALPLSFAPPSSWHTLLTTRTPKKKKKEVKNNREEAVHIFLLYLSVERDVDAKNKKKVRFLVEYRFRLGI